MTNNLEETVYAVIGGIIMLGILWWYVTSEQMERHRFMKDCGTHYSQEECEELWEGANA